jgi:hypothetical protein
MHHLLRLLPHIFDLMVLGLIVVCLFALMSLFLLVCPVKKHEGHVRFPKKASFATQFVAPQYLHATILHYYTTTF